MVEEWVYLSLEKRTRNGFVKADVPYYHVAFQPLSYRIEDGGTEGDNLEHTYAAMKTAAGELTPKDSARQELVDAFTKLGFTRNTNKDLQNSSAIGKVFKVRRFNRMFKINGEERRGELMNLPTDILPADWAPAPGVDVPVYQRAFRERTGSAAPVQSGGVARPIGMTLAGVAEALVAGGVKSTESAVKAFVLDRADLAVGEALDLCLSNSLLAEMVKRELVTADGEVLAAA